MNNRLPRDAEKMTRQLSDKLMQSAQDAVDSTRGLASQALDSADGAVRSARGRIEPAIDEFAHSAHRIADRGIALASETSARAQRSLRQCAAATERYVADQPIRAVLIAAAAGAVAAALMLAASRKRRHAKHRQD
ncbi:MAG TPA: hypothetical protein VMS38_02745 [Pseudorhodoferax sp.]|nr:hypothetical protein [Pseudorhodoferax sp.]